MLLTMRKPDRGNARMRYENQNPALERAPVGSNRRRLHRQRRGFAGQPVSNRSGGEDEMALPRQRRPQPTRDDLVIRNCLLVRDAAEAWAASPAACTPQTPSRVTRRATPLSISFLAACLSSTRSMGRGRTEVPLLRKTRGKRIICTTTATDAGNAGWTNCGHDGYMITGFGESGEIFRFARNWPDDLAELDSRTIANCFVVPRRP